MPAENACHSVEPSDTFFDCKRNSDVRTELTFTVSDKLSVTKAAASMLSSTLFSTGAMASTVNTFTPRLYTGQVQSTHGRSAGQTVSELIVLSADSQPYQ